MLLCMPAACPVHQLLQASVVQKAVADLNLASLACYLMGLQHAETLSF